jgi:ABC-type lipoprotein export system ATPase subunit
MSFLVGKNIEKEYMLGNSPLHVLKKINIVIEKKEFVAITGKSGSGKSTLMHILGCLDTVTNGSYEIDGTDVSNASKNELAFIRSRKIGFVFQQFNLLSDLTALDNVALPRLYAGDSEVTALKKSHELLEKFDLADRKNHFPFQLSGGQQQRVAIARSIVNNPEIILADEPTGNLDTKTGEMIIDTLNQLNRENNVTIILVTHERYIAKKTKRIIELLDGTIITDSKTMKEEKS